jgi:internalin A
MENLWVRLEQQLTTHAPTLRDSLRSGASWTQLEEAEARIGQKMPSELRDAYLAHDGSNFDWVEGRLGLFGTYQWLSLEELVKEWENHGILYDEEDPYFYDESDESWSGLPILPWQTAPPYWIPIGVCPVEGSRLYVDLKPGPTGAIGQLVVRSFNGVGTGVLSAGFNAYLCCLLSGLETGEVVVTVLPNTSTEDWERADGSNFSPPGNKQVFG